MVLAVILELIDLLLGEILLLLEPVLARIAANGEVVAGCWRCSSTHRASVHATEPLVLRHKGRVCEIDVHSTALRRPVICLIQLRPDGGLHLHGFAHRVVRGDLVALIVEDADHFVVHEPSAHASTVRVSQLICFRELG